MVLPLAPVDPNVPPSGCLECDREEVSAGDAPPTDGLPCDAHAPPALTLSADAGTASVSTFISSSSSSASSSGEGADEDTELSKVDTHQVHATHLKWGVKLGAGACAEVWQAEYAGKGYAIKKPKSMEEVRIAHADRTRDLARVAHAESNPYSD
jgi:hypothetical protein